MFAGLVPVMFIDTFIAVVMFALSMVTKWKLPTESGYWVRNIATSPLTGLRFVGPLYWKLPYL